MRLKNGDVLFIWPLALHVITAGWTYNNGSAHNAIDLRPALVPHHPGRRLDGSLEAGQHNRYLIRVALKRGCAV